MLELVNNQKTKEPNKCFKITYSSKDTELIMASSMGITEELKGLIAFYSDEDNLVCMINQNYILKIETVIAPKIVSINNGEKKYE